MAARVLFLCARESSRSLLAASFLAARAANRWEAWGVPTQDALGLQLAEQVLREQGIALISPSFLIRPGFGRRWEEGVYPLQRCSRHLTHSPRCQSAPPLVYRRSAGN